MTIKTPKKLIEVALPLDKINEAAAREKSIRHGHPSTLHLWWARRPLAAARAVIFAQMVNDPGFQQGGGFKYGKNKAEAAKERQRLFRIMEKLVLWENTTNEDVLEEARAEIWRSWREVCELNKDHPQAAELFNPDQLPAFHDPFAGGGALPLEAQRLGLTAYASDLNPVAVTINKAMIEIPPKFAGREPVGPLPKGEKRMVGRTWPGATGLAEDVRRYGAWMRLEAEKRIGHLYPPVEITEDMAKDRPDLKPLIGHKLTVIAWIWARTVKSPNPAFNHVHVPLASTFVLSSKAGKEAYVQPLVEGDQYWFEVKVGELPEGAKDGTKLSRGANFRCLLSGVPISASYIKSEGCSGNIGDRLMAIVAEGKRGRVYLPPTKGQEVIARSTSPAWKPDIEFAKNSRHMTPWAYGLSNFGSLFSSRQLVAMSTFSELVGEAIEKCYQDAVINGMSDDGLSYNSGGIGAISYAQAVGVYLSFGVSKCANRANNLSPWMPSVQCPGHLFRRHAITMCWDYSESNVLYGPSGSICSMIDGTADGISMLSTKNLNSKACLVDAATQTLSFNKVISSDPPYYDNVPYADLSDFFYVWMRRSLRSYFPDIFASLVVPKNEELVADSFRHKSKEAAEIFFLKGMKRAIHNLASQAHPSFPVTIYYAFKQNEGKDVETTSSTGWETFLEAILEAGFVISGT